MRFFGGALGKENPALRPGCEELITEQRDHALGCCSSGG